MNKQLKLKQKGRKQPLFYSKSNTLH